ncbi:hypothetical protein N7462_001229 [Penicillium macrosclerotiorum]|uniref:uncharacterized protein n=1 Tax=Penicillium macrosclerotiorum TaxID=303699 RepID=UPI0025497897|nr:uncharacterized protein N7462_001229 [Penicillium macrosclerotiorum]KAJ5691806.1 hypothetical protein N7462_001229 [Penicillium macrosclerotiorum]
MRVKIGLCILMGFGIILVSTVRSSSEQHSNKPIKSTELHSYSISSKSTARPRHPTPGMSILEGKDSEENILPEVEEGAIMKTTDISLHYESGFATRETGEHDGQVMPTERI